MNLKKIRLVLLSILCFAFLNVSAQEDYLAEIGISAGGAYYLGDANNQLFSNPQLAYGTFFRYRFNPRIALKAEFNRAKIAWDGNSIGNQVNALDVCGEFNFFDLDPNLNKRTSRTFSPYIFAGIGMINNLYIGNNTYNASIPFGVGVKLKIAPRWNLNAQWSNRLSMSDKMEGVLELNNSGNLNGSNFTNNDLFSTFAVGISYDFWERPCDCKNIKH